MYELKVNGDRLHELRKHRGLSAEDLGRKADVSTRHLVRLENGERGAGSEILARLALALQTSMEYLMGIIDDDRSIFTLADQQPQRPGTKSPPGKWLAGLHMPPHWEEAHGYEGEQRYIAIWWAKRGDELWIDDGQIHFPIGNRPPTDDLIQILIRAGQSTTLDTLGYATPEASHCLLFDREERSVYHVSVEEAQIWLEGHTDLSDKPPSSSEETSPEAEACLHCDGQGWIRASECLEDGYVRCASCEGGDGADV